MIISQPITNDRGRFAAALNNALSTSYGAQDGDVIQLTGFASANDGGAQPLRYDATSTATVDGVFTFPGKGGALSFDGVTFDGTAGTGRYKALDTTTADLMKIGADATGIADASSALQRALTAVPVAGKIVVPAGTYLIKDVAIPDNKKIRIVGDGARFLAAPGATYILNVGADTTRDNPLHISGLTLDGNDIASIIGMDMPIRTNTLLEAITFRRCHYGLNLMGYNMKLESCVFQGNVVGTRIYQDASSGGGNGNTYDNVEWYGNTIGFVMDGTATSALPCQSSVFQGGVIQNNSLCGAAFFQTSNSMFMATHFEANATAGSTLSVGGRTVRKANIHVNNSTLKVIHLSPAYTSPNIVLENGASVEVDGAEFYGTTTGPWIRDLDGDGSVYLSGRIAAGTQLRAKTYSLPGKILPYISFSFSGLPVVKHHSGVTNLMLTPNTPTLSNAAGCTVNPATVDAEQGPASSVTFAASAGSTSTNRITISTGVGTVSTGDKVIISFLVKTSDDTELVFELTDGNFARYDYLSTDREWRRIVLMVDSTTTNTPSLYVYPADSGGATVLITKMMTHKVASGNDDTMITRIMREGLYNDNTDTVAEGTDVDLTLTPNSPTTLIYPSTVAGFRRVALPTVARENSQREISRLDAGDGTLYLNGANLLLSKNQWARLRHDGTVWRPVQSGGDGTIVTAAEYIANDSDLVNRWNGDANLDTTGDPNDVQGNANLTWSGTPAYDTAPANAEDGLAFDFDGSVYLTAASTVMDYTDDFTVAFWLYLDSTASMRLVSKRDVTNAWDITHSSGRFNVYDGTATFNSAASSATQETWLHVAVVADGAASRFYVNGVASGDAFEPSISSSTSDVYIGRYPLSAASFLVGKMADIRIINRPLTAAEVYMLYAGGA